MRVRILPGLLKAAGVETCQGCISEHKTMSSSDKKTKECIYCRKPIKDGGVMLIDAGSFCSNECRKKFLEDVTLWEYEDNGGD